MIPRARDRVKTSDDRGMPHEEDTPKSSSPVTKGNTPRPSRTPTRTEAPAQNLALQHINEFDLGTGSVARYLLPIALVKKEITDVGTKSGRCDVGVRAWLKPPQRP
jgi:hypothetical protein